MNNEDIKVLENLIVTLENHHLGGIQAIENLIKRNKELERYEKYYKNERVELIPKSKIKAKIEELENKMPPDDDYAFEIQNDIYSKINILQELLEGDK